MDDPVEAVIAAALDKAGIEYTRDPRKTERLDFYLTNLNLYIECKMFHSDRIAEQMSRAPNVIAIQGMHAAQVFAVMIGLGHKNGLVRLG